MESKWLEKEVAARGHGAQARLAEYLGLSPSVMNKMIKGTRKRIAANEADRIREWLRSNPPGGEIEDAPRPDTPQPRSTHKGSAAALQQGLDLNRPWRQLKPGRHAEPQPDQSEPVPPTEAIRAPEAPPPPLRSEMPKDVPVYGTVVGGSGQGNLFDFELNGTIVDYVRRPPRIAGRADVFAAYVQGDSMMHWRKSGQLIYLERAKPPAIMDYVLVEMLPVGADAVRPALVKQLLGITPTKIKLRQHNPPKDFEIERRSVLQVYRVMDWDELLGV